MHGQRNIKMHSKFGIGLSKCEIQVESGVLAVHIKTAYPWKSYATNNGSEGAGHKVSMDFYFSSQLFSDPYNININS